LLLSFLCHYSGGTRGGCLSLTNCNKQQQQPPLNPTPSKQEQSNHGDDRSNGSNTLVLEDEIMFSYTDRILEVTARDFSNILFNFIETCIHLRTELLTVGMQPTISVTP
jgi:hypothetical protein